MKLKSSLNGNASFTEEFNDSSDIPGMRAGVEESVAREVDVSEGWPDHTRKHRDLPIDLASSKGESFQAGKRHMKQLVHGSIHCRRSNNSR